jgi:hypothetical protein
MCDHFTSDFFASVYWLRIAFWDFEIIRYRLVMTFRGTIRTLVWRFGPPREAKMVPSHYSHTWMVNNLSLDDMITWSLFSVRITHFAMPFWSWLFWETCQTCPFYNFRHRSSRYFLPLEMLSLDLTSGGNVRLRNMMWWLDTEPDSFNFTVWSNAQVNNVFVGVIQSSSISMLFPLWMEYVVQPWLSLETRDSDPKWWMPLGDRKFVQWSVAWY